MNPVAVVIALTAPSVTAQIFEGGGAYDSYPACHDILGPNQKSEISTDDWVLSYSFSVTGTLSCTYTTYSTAFAYWDSNQQFTVRYQEYYTPLTGGLCTAGDSEIEYYSNDVLYTANSDFPYTQSSICGYKFLITNDIDYEDQVILVYTTGAYRGLALSMAAVVSLVSSYILF